MNRTEQKLNSQEGQRGSPRHRNTSRDLRASVLHRETGSSSFLWPEGQAKTREDYTEKEQLIASLEPTAKASTGP